MGGEGRGRLCFSVARFANESPNYDSACFHTQQCIEKYLKGILQSDDIPFAKTHDLCLLLDACFMNTRSGTHFVANLRPDGVCRCIPISRAQCRPR